MRADERAHFAKTVLENPVFLEAFTKLESNAVNRAVAAKPDEHDLRVTALAEVRALRAFRSHCEAIARNTEAPKDVSA